MGGPSHHMLPIWAHSLGLCFPSSDADVPDGCQMSIFPLDGIILCSTDNFLVHYCLESLFGLLSVSRGAIERKFLSWVVSHRWSIFASRPSVH